MWSAWLDSAAHGGMLESPLVAVTPWHRNRIAAPPSDHSGTLRQVHQQHASHSAAVYLCQAHSSSDELLGVPSEDRVGKLGCWHGAYRRSLVRSTGAACRISGGLAGKHYQIGGSVTRGRHDSMVLTRRIQGAMLVAHSFAVAWRFRITWDQGRPCRNSTAGRHQLTKTTG